MTQTLNPPSDAKVVEGSDGLLLEIDGQDSFRIRSYRNAAQAICFYLRDHRGHAAENEVDLPAEQIVQRGVAVQRRARQVRADLPLRQQNITKFGDIHL